MKKLLIFALVIIGLSMLKKNDGENEPTANLFGQSSSVDSDHFNTNNSSETKSQNWDALLKAYEQYVDQCVSYAKKAAKGDMGALSDYPSMMEKAQEFCNGMSEAQANMSASQWERYLKITSKMATAAQELAMSDGIMEAAALANSAISDAFEDDNYSYNYRSSSNTQDWDSLLDSYEQYVDKYITYLKKAAKGDLNALSDYPALMEKAEEFCDKMSDAQADMTSSQWSRYMKITNKLSKAALDL